MSAQIVGLTVENVKRIKAFALKPKGDGLVVIGGENEAGKTSVLDAIACTLGGAALCPGEAVRRGEKKGRVEIVLDGPGLKIERRFNASGTTSLTVSSADGKTRLTSPQAVLDKLVGSLTFDPLAFAQMKADAQADTLRRLTGLDVSDLDEAEKTAYEARTEVNRDAKRLATEAAAVQTDPDADVPDEPVSVVALADELDKARQRNGEMDRLDNAVRNAERILESEQARLAGCEADISETEAEIKRLQAKLAGLHDGRRNHVQAVSRAEGVLEQARSALAAFKPLDTAPIEDRIANAETINAEIRARKSKADLEAQAQAKADESAALTARLEKIADDRRKRIAALDMPIEGLSLDADGVRYEGTLFAECSAAQRLRVSVAIGIAMNPDLKVMLIRDGSLLDSKNLAMIEEMAKASGSQIWIERVGDGAEVSVVLEAGEVKELRQ